MGRCLCKYMGGISSQEFFAHFGLDPIQWVVPHRPADDANEYYDPEQGDIGFLESRRIASDNWRIDSETIAHNEYPTTRLRFVTPKD